MRVLLAMILAMMATHAVYAGVVRVEKDGSGDYTIIQDAMDAVAPGDTILIGPGRYNDGFIVTTPGWTETVRAIVRVDELTIIGAGSSQTIIGPAKAYDRADGEHRGIEFSDYWGAKRLKVERISFENMREALDGDMLDPVGSELTLVECRFFGNEQGCSGSVERVGFYNCEVLNVAYTGYGIVLVGSGYLSVSDCDFRALVPWTGITHLYSLGSREVNISNSDFKWGNVGFYVGGGGDASLTNCTFDSQASYGAGVGTQASSALSDCYFTNQKEWAIRTGGDGITLEIDRINVTDAVYGTLLFRSPINGYVHGSLLAKGENYVVVADTDIVDPESPISFHFDMTNNWWGTDDPGSIQAVIFDAVADTQSSTVVDWAPFKDEPVGAEKRSLGSLKSMFR